MASKRRVIEDIIKENPGIGFAELRETTGFANGTLQYHVNHSDLVEAKRRALIPNGHCEHCRFQETCTTLCKLKLLRDTTKREVLKQKRRGRSQKQIADELNLHPTTISYHVRTLRDQGLLR